ncbi:NAD-dependent epimerase/dehydratase family protein [Persicitalea jodogahamensis]|uniref:NAD-dependent epimerase/dehydratase domain-containing protein n=1 Tax=Persicitalea jodogahamensis TaxID=402147 RepID=A0A8J3DCI6_9BACT|nr:NAD-dependent epimerase/dehydratase family protein [Persicitalea jodogahamensis]GHB83037.1 hypothetical protein GCM10007390_42450 [Persicitalea jodogahamensis]
MKTGITLGSLTPLLSIPLIGTAKNKQESPRSVERAVHPLSILILGGTSFLGPQQIAYALQRGHRVSTFTRGRTQPTVKKDIFDEVESLIGDRENDLEALKNRKWDVVIDNSGNRVKWVKDTAELLKESCDLYLYTSSTGVYYPYLGKDIRENTKPVLKVPDGITQVQKYEYDYGVMKALSEIEVVKSFGKDRSIIVRPTYMMGPGDQTDRFTYWPERIARGGEVLVPGKPDDPVQYIDVRDVAGFMIRLAENHKAGTYNAVGPPSVTTMEAFVYGVHAAFSSKASFVMIPDYEFLAKHNVPDAIPWIMPVGDNLGSARIDNSFGVENGLTFTPLADSVRDIHAWWNSEAVEDVKRIKLLSGPDSLAERESALLAAWKARR